MSSFIFTLLYMCEVKLQIIENHNAELVLNNFLPKQIIDLKPVVAGGFVTALYKNIIMAKNTDKVKQSLFECFKLENPKKYEEFFDEFPLVFGDIDLWFLNDNVIWNDITDQNYFIQNYKADQDKYDKNHFFFSNIVGSYKTYNEHISLNTYYFKKFGLEENITKSTSWANSFIYRDPAFKKMNSIQFIKKPYESVEDIFNNFDLDICSVAYYDGKFYISDLAKRNFVKNELTGNFANNVVNKLWSAQRAFKYAKRYSLEFSKELCEDITKIFFEGEALCEEYKELELENGPVYQIDNAYGKGLFSKENIIKLKKSLGKFFPILVSMKNFNEDSIFLFLNSKDKNISGTVKAYFKKQEHGVIREVSWDEYDPIIDKIII